MNKLFSFEALLATFPEALKESDNIYSLAIVTSKELKRLYDDNNLLALYTRIDELSEEVLDILAIDLKVYWYLPNGTIEAKRAQIKSSFFIHRRLGTKAAMAQALADICPGTVVKEWFEYGGLPHHFSVEIDMTNSRASIDYAAVKAMIDIFKPLRSVLDDVETIYKTSLPVCFGGTISTFKNIILATETVSIPVVDKYLCNENGFILTNEEGKALVV